jgi:pimeloyl-ACP methyl ester carboxylesterase
MYVRIGGIDQWIQIAGEDSESPVLLWLNGGPGGSTMPYEPAYSAWERSFILVMWDQRGEGKTFDRNGESEASTMTLDRMTADGIELAELLKKRLHKPRIILLGHSWGSVLGVHMITQRPDLFSVYVGTAQVTHLNRQFEAAYLPLRARAPPDSRQLRSWTRWDLRRGKAKAPTTS